MVFRETRECWFPNFWAEDILNFDSEEEKEILIEKDATVVCEAREFCIKWTKFFSCLFYKDEKMY